MVKSVFILCFSVVSLLFAKLTTINPDPMDYKSYGIPEMEKYWGDYEHRVVHQDIKIGKDLKLFLVEVHAYDSSYVDHNGDSIFAKVYHRALVCKDLSVKVHRADASFKATHKLPPLDSCNNPAVNIHKSGPYNLTELGFMGDSLSLYHPFEAFKKAYYVKDSTLVSTGLLSKPKKEGRLLFFYTAESAYKIEYLYEVMGRSSLYIYYDSTGTGAFASYPLDVASRIPSIDLQLEEGQDSLIKIDCDDFLDGVPKIGFKGGGSDKLKCQPIGYAIAVNNDTLLLADVTDHDFLGIDMDGASGEANLCLTALDTQYSLITCHSENWEEPINKDSLYKWEDDKPDAYDTLLAFYSPLPFLVELAGYGGEVIETAGPMGPQYHVEYWSGVGSRRVWYVQCEKQVIKIQLDSLVCPHAFMDSAFFRISSLPHDHVSISNSKRLTTQDVKPLLKKKELVIPTQLLGSNVEIFTPSGRRVIMRNTTLTDRIDLNGLANGVYLYRIYLQDNKILKGQFLLK